MKKTILGIALMSSTTLFAHTAIMSCFDNGDDTITCEGGFSDGSSASGVAFSLEQNGKVVLKTKLSEDSDITFDKLKGDFDVVFDAGEGHSIYINSSDIVE